MPVYKWTAQDHEAFKDRVDPDYPQRTAEHDIEWEPFEDFPGVASLVEDTTTVPELSTSVEAGPEQESEPEPEQEVAAEGDTETEVEDAAKVPLVLPTKRGVRVTKKFFDSIPAEIPATSSAVRPRKYEVEMVAAIGRNAKRQVVLCVKWKGYAWDRSTWEPMKNVDKKTKDELVARWGALGNIKANSQPIGDIVDEEDEEEDDEEEEEEEEEGVEGGGDDDIDGDDDGDDDEAMPPPKKAKFTYLSRKK